MTNYPEVTWLLSTKNSMPFLRQTLESISVQTYPYYKVLVWDDCSNDGTLEELQRWIPGRLPGIIHFGQSRRLGPSLAFLVEQADTELCARIDGDDINLAHRLRQQVEFLSQHPEVGVVGGQIQIIDQQGTVCDTWHYPTDDATIRWCSRWEPRLCHPAVLFRRSLVLAAGNYRDVKAEDADLWQRLSHLTEFRNLPELLIQYRRTENSATGAIQDYLPMNRAQARQNASILFPNISDPAQAMELWEATYPSQLHGPSKYRHIRELEKAAVSFSRRVNKPRDYFLNTDLYREQRFHLRRRFFQRIGLMPLVRLRESLRASTHS
jgi:glycosyltransferase involved in cell wall biosynthesis